MQSIYECSDCGSHFRGTHRACSLCGQTGDTSRGTCSDCGGRLIESPDQCCPICGSEDVTRVSFDVA